jgi:hypothetical protein
MSTDSHTGQTPGTTTPEETVNGDRIFKLAFIVAESGQIGVRADNGGLSTLEQIACLQVAIDAIVSSMKRALDGVEETEGQ